MVGETQCKKKNTIAIAEPNLIFRAIPNTLQHVAGFYVL